jgi:hypothetical protein
MLSESSPFTTITSFAATDTDGSYERLITSTARAYKWMIVSIGTSQQAITGLLDISVGADGFEVNFMDDRMLGVRAGPFERKNGHLFYFPVDVAAGVEIRARIQDTSSSAIAWRMKVMFSDVAPPSGTPTKLDSNSRVTVSSAGSADAYGSYVNLITSTAHAGKWLLIGPGRANFVGNPGETEWSIGVGGPPTGTDAIDEFGNLSWTGRAATTRSFLVPCDFAAGSQLQVRVKDDNTGVINYQFTIQVLG